MSVREFVGYLETDQPLLHNHYGQVESPVTGEAGQRRYDNETDFRRLTFIIDGARRLVPVISGNSFRGLFRRLAATHMLETLGLDARAFATRDKARTHQTLYAGGQLEKRSERQRKGEEPVPPRGPLSIGHSGKLRELIPLVGLMGCSINDEILPGSLRVGFAVPITQETAGRLNEPVHADLPLLDSITDRTHLTRLGDRELGKDSGQMIYHVEYLAPWVRLQQRFSLTNSTDLEASLFHLILDLFIADPHVGGKVSGGFGRVKVSYGFRDQLPPPDLYSTYLAEHKEEVVSYIHSWE